MKKKLFSFLCCVAAMLVMSANSNAQSKLIYFWNFNGITSGTTVHLPTINTIPADYNVGTTTAEMYWEPAIPVSSSYASYSDVTVAVTADFDTVNQAPTSTYSVTTGNWFRARNPADSMQLVFTIPSTNYQNITIRYGVETSSITSGDSANVYSYSTNGGVSWQTIGLSTPATVLNTATWDTFRAAQVTITDPAANNNPNLEFKIQLVGRNHTTSGNNRFDNISVKGDTIIPGGTLVHFWDFNAMTGFYGLYPVCGTAVIPFPYLNPDYTIHPAANAYVTEKLMGTATLNPATNPNYLDEVASVTADYDTVNENWAALGGVVAGGTALRPRNPLDSVYLEYYMPTSNYKNINLTYASESSSYTSGDSIQVFSYSVDSGLTWRLSGISEAWDSASVTFRKINVKFTDPAANNCPTLFFRIAFVGRSAPNAVCPSAPSGNNRFDNISVQGDSILSPLPTITTTPATFGPYCNTVANTFNVAFTANGGVGGSFLVQITNANGTFPTDFTSNIIGSGYSSPISATIPSAYTTGSLYRVRVISAYPGIYGSDNGNNITVAGVAGPISGPSTVCVGSNATLIESGSGTWTSSNIASATIGTGTGIVTGVAQGTSMITFSVGPGCNAYETLTVNPLPAIIGGTPSACIGTSTTLTDGTPSGAWSGSASAIATVGTGTGIVTGVSAGTLVVTYTIPTGCYQIQNVTINPLPLAVTGTTTFCQGSTTNLSDLTTGGTWSSSNTAIATVGTTGIVSGVGSGAPLITYTSPLGCLATTTLNVNPTPTPILGGTSGCVGNTTGLTDLTAFGAWISSNTAVATIGFSTGVLTGVGLGTSVITYELSTGCLITETVSIHSLPSGITGTATFCAGATTTLSDVTSGGTWSSSNTAIASVGTSGNVTSISGAGGNPIIYYNLPTGCAASVTLSVNPSPSTISGSTTVYCIGDSTTLSDAVFGGTWFSSTTSIATIGSTSGVVTSVAPGVTNITYTLPDGCLTSIVESVVPSAAPIAGSSNLCSGSSYNYTDETAFGEWTSSNSGVATVGSGDGIVTAVGTGSVIITYGLSLACTTTATITVNPLPAAITGTTNVCAGLSTTLSDTGSGTWSASDAYLASVGATTGTVSGLVASILNITYTLPTGCTTFTTFTVNPVPATITGTANVCVGLTTALNETTTGGLWLSSDVTLANVSSLGTVTGVSSGTPVISYQLPTGCLTSIPVTVNPLPAAIGGSAMVCMGLTTSLSDASTGGSWSSSDVTLATVVSGTGVVTGVLSGMPMITYTLPTGCIATTTVTVNASYPIVGPSTLCVGLSNTFTDAVTGGTWSSSNTSVATIDLISGSLSSLIPGTSTITYVSPAGCSQTENVTVISLPAPISGTTSICQGFTSTLTDGSGIWISSDPGVADINIGTGFYTGVSAGTAIVTYYLSLSSIGSTCYNTTEVTINPLPAAITGITPLCQSAAITLSDTSSGGSWSSSNTTVATIDAVAGVATGVSSGSTTIAYTLPTGCVTTNILTVNPIMPVTGANNVCQGMDITLSDAVTGGSWSSSNTTAATVDPVAGAVSGLAAGNTVIAYTMPTGCVATDTVTVNPLAAITGGTTVCAGLTTTLSNVNTGGTWSSSNTSVSTVDPSLGIVTGVGGGADTISYILPTGCTASTILTVNPLPTPIDGLSSLCTGLSYSFSDDAGGGTWSSSDATVASIDAGMGTTMAIATGNATITYTLPTGCIGTTLVTVNASPAPVSGAIDVCVGGTTVFSDTGTGTWSSSNVPVATIGAGTGIASGLSAGLAVISYTLPDGCLSDAILTVNAVAPIMGTTHVCAASATTLSDTVSGGSWSSSNTLIANVISGTGVVTGVSAGMDTIIYTLSSGCFTTAPFTVYRVPAVYTVTGGGSYCAGSTGININLSGSETGVNYQLYDTTTSGLPHSGTGSVLSFGPETAAGSYNVVATDTATSCSNDMDGFATITIIPAVTPSVNLSDGIGDTVCAGQLITFTATPVNGGTLPTYSWTYNTHGTSVYANDYHVFPNNGDVITVTLVSNAICATPDTVTKSVTITVDSAYEPVVYITANPGFSIKPRESVTFNANVTGGGARPTYQWLVNGGAISGATSAIYTTDTLSINEHVSCTVKGSGMCGVSSTVSVDVNVSNLGIQSLSSGGHFTLFPNPNNGSFTLKGTLGTATDQEVSITVTDMLGQVVYSNKATAQNGAVNEQILLNNNLANGMYMLILNAGTENEVFHFVIGQ